MSETSNIRTTIHSYWESFVPSALYTTGFVVVWVSLLGVSNVLAVLNAPKVVGILRRGEVSQVLKDLELLKLLPFAAVLLVAVMLYLFDRIVNFVGSRLPPHVVWRGSSVLYWSEYIRRELWMLLPHVTNPMALNFEARVVIDQAIAEKSGLTKENSDFNGESMNRAIRLGSFAKAGVLWVVVSLVWALALRRPAAPQLFLSVAFGVCFVMLAFVSWVQQTYWFILGQEQQGRLAMKILFSKNIHPSGGQERKEELERAFENSVRYSGRFVHLSWGSLENYRRLYRAFFGSHRSSPMRRTRPRGSR